MSDQIKVSRRIKKIVDEDFSPSSSKPRPAKPIQPIVSNGNQLQELKNNNQIVRRQLQMVIDMLDVDDMDEKTLRHNIKIGIKFLKDVSENLLKL
jgi:hypothetical protein